MQLPRIGSDGVPAPFAVRKRHHSVDIRGEGACRKMRGNKLGSMRGAIAGGCNSDVVARSDTSVRASLSEKSRNVLGDTPQRSLLLRGSGELSRRKKRQVVQVDMFAGLDRGSCDTDGAAVTDQVRTCWDIAKGELVTCGNECSNRHAESADEYHCTWIQRHASDSYVIRGMQTDR